MKPWAILLTVLGMVAFMTLVVRSTLQSAEVECQVCLQFQGELVCRNGAGATEEEALQAAQESACGGNVSGMAELIACRGAPPVRAQCPPPP
ncbi:MAG: hypothetical protein WEA09_15405 [Gemmatimonadota bacterium]